VTPGLRRLYAPNRAEVEVGPSGTPSRVDGTAVAAVREEWRVDDRYFELAMVDGRSLVVFRCGVTGRWHRQRA
jgi:hypothetical protein